MTGHYGRIVFSGARAALTQEQRNRLAAFVCWWAERCEETGVGDCPTGVDACVRVALITPPRIFVADWDRLGAGAGPVRNRSMVRWAAKRPNSVLVAFPSPQSKGT